MPPRVVAGVEGAGGGRRGGGRGGLRGLTGGGGVLIRGGRIAWVGPTPELPKLSPAVRVLDATGKVVLPGLVDSHTHLIFAGARADEFEARLQGKTYQEIAAAGGGINATVRRV